MMNRINFKMLALWLLLLSQPSAIWAQQPQLKLPLPNGVTSLCTQGAGGSVSHNVTSTRHDIDLDTSNTSDEVVTAGAAGTAYTFADANNFGNHINIDLGLIPNDQSGDHYFIVVGHLKMFLVRTGQSVTQGQPIGIEGCTGNCGGDHVHYGLHRGNPQSNAVYSTSITANSIAARDVTTNGQFTTYTSDQFVGGEIGRAHV